VTEDSMIRIVREPEPPELPLPRYWRQREEQIAAAQLRWATEIVNLDDD
jgi:hypothetical protein